MNDTPPCFRRWSVLLGAALARSWLAAPLPASPQRAELAIGIGIESLQDPSVDLVGRLGLVHDAHVGGFSLAVGRPDGRPSPGTTGRWPAAKVTGPTTTASRRPCLPSQVIRSAG